MLQSEVYLREVIFYTFYQNLISDVTSIHFENFDFEIPLKINVDCIIYICRLISNFSSMHREKQDTASITIYLKD